MWSLKVIHNVSKVIVKVVLDIREYMIHERIPYMKSKRDVNSYMQSVKVLVKGISEDTKDYVICQLNS